MHRFMVRLSHVMRRWRWAVVVAWIVLVGFSFPFSRMNGDNLSAGFSGVEGSESETVQNALDGGDFGTAGNPQIGVVVDPAADATTQQVENAVTRIDNAAMETQHVHLSSQNLEQAQEAAQSGQRFIVPLRINTTLAGSVQLTQSFIDNLDAGKHTDKVSTYVFGQSALQAEQVDEADSGAQTASDVSLAVILILLLAAFGGLVAAL